MAENSESAVLRAIAELEAEPEPDEIDELVRWQLETGSLREGYSRLRPGEYVIAAAVDREINQLCQDYITRSLTGIPPMRLTGPVCLRRISPVTKQPYPPEADTRALRPVWDSRMRPYSTIVADILGDAGLRIDYSGIGFQYPIPEWTPHQEHRQRRGRGMTTSLIVVDEIPPLAAPTPEPHAPGILGLIRDGVQAALRAVRR